METYIPDPVFRRLRGYAFDPSLSLQLDTVIFNEITFKVRWEGKTYPDGKDRFKRGPISDYLEIIDYDPASKCFYEPVDLNDERLLATDGLEPSESNPLFHQQMVYAVAMTTIQNFERALGRKVLWAGKKTYKPDGEIDDEDFVERLRIYPHALRQPNAYYSPQKVSLLFGYFPASADAPELQMPGGMVFTCLSHDIIAHETTHALLDGMHRRFIEANHPDTLAFHEAFSDIVALFQHFTFPEVLRHQIAKTRGDLASQNILGELAQQFGKAIGNYGALREAIGKVNPETKQWELLKPNPEDYLTVFEPHARGSILVATIFDAFLSIYKNRISDLLRIATNGTGILPDGEILPDLVNRLADEAAKSAQHILGICIRALDYCPPVDITFGDYLRAIITADIDVVPDDTRNYRVAIIEAFRRRGIYPRDVRNLSVESLSWKEITEPNQKGLFQSIADKDFADSAEDAELKDTARIGRTLGEFMKLMDYEKDRREIYEKPRRAREFVRKLIKATIFNDSNQRNAFEKLTGIKCLPNRGKQIRGLEIDSEGFYEFEIHSLRGARRNGQDGKQVNQVIFSITQKREVSIKDKETDEETGEKFIFRGGTTLIFNLEDLTLRYAINNKPIDDRERLERHRAYHSQLANQSLYATYFAKSDAKDFKGKFREPFAILHGIGN